MKTPMTLTEKVLHEVELGLASLAKKVEQLMDQSPSPINSEIVLFAAAVEQLRDCHAVLDKGVQSTQAFYGAVNYVLAMIRHLKGPEPASFDQSTMAALEQVDQSQTGGLVGFAATGADDPAIGDTDNLGDFIYDLENFAHSILLIEPLLQKSRSPKTASNMH